MIDRRSSLVSLLAAVFVSGASHAQDVAAPLGQLDGRVFEVAIGPAEDSPDLSDEIHFNNGMFRSLECERTCGYEPAPYFTRTTPSGVEFVATLECPLKSATLRWRGEVASDRVSGTIHWRSKRWYWTVERDFGFVGEFRPDDVAGLAGQ